MDPQYCKLQVDKAGALLHCGKGHGRCCGSCTTLLMSNWRVAVSNHSQSHGCCLSSKAYQLKPPLFSLSYLLKISSNFSGTKRPSVSKTSAHAHSEIISDHMDSWALNSGL